MAQKVQVMLVCDLHEDEVEGVETIAFGLDGSSYELDACEQHATQMREAFAPYVGAARRAGRAPASPAPRRTSRTTSRPSSSSAGSRDQVQAKREWARAHGYTVSDRGRLSAEVLQAYDAAH